MTQRDEEVRAYLAAWPAHWEGRERWPVQGEMSVRLSLAERLPPGQVSSSILAIVLDERRRVLFLWPSRPSGSIAHLLIGGRPENGETPEETSIREVGEETGWRVEPIRMIGFRHFFQLEPRREESDRPYPDFIQPIFAARALEFEPQRLIAKDRIEAEFLEFDEVERAIEAGQRPLLYAAEAVRKSG